MFNKWKNKRDFYNKLEEIKKCVYLYYNQNKDYPYAMEYYTLLRLMFDLNINDPEVINFMEELKEIIYEFEIKKSKFVFNSEEEENFYKRIEKIYFNIRETKRKNPNYVFCNAIEIENLLKEFSKLKTNNQNINPNINGILYYITRDIVKFIDSIENKKLLIEYQERLNDLGIKPIEEILVNNLEDKIKVNQKIYKYI